MLENSFWDGCVTLWTINSNDSVTRIQISRPQVQCEAVTRRNSVCAVSKLKWRIPNWLVCSRHKENFQTKWRDWYLSWNWDARFCVDKNSNHCKLISKSKHNHISNRILLFISQRGLFLISLIQVFSNVIVPFLTKIVYKNNKSSCWFYKNGFLINFLFVWIFWINNWNENILVHLNFVCRCYERT